MSRIWETGENAQEMRSRCLELMQDGEWHSLTEFLTVCKLKYGTASLTARIRDLRKTKFGAHNIESRNRKAQLFEYRLVPGVSKPRRNSVSRLLEDLGKLIATNKQLKAELSECFTEIAELRRALTISGTH
jgi:hypothetical protein